MKWKEFKKHLQQDNIACLYLFSGGEKYLIDLAYKILEEKLIDPNFKSLNQTIFHDKDFELSKFQDAVETLPFMAEKRLVVVKDPLFLGAQKKGTSKEEEEQVLKTISNLSPAVCVIFLSSKVDARKKLVKTIKKQGKHFQFDPLEESELLRWIKGKLSKEGIQSDQSTLNYFVANMDYLGRNRSKSLFDVENEVNKLIHYTKKRGRVTQQDIDQITSKSFENDIFKVMDAIEKKNKREALRQMEELIYQGEPVLKILATLSNQMKNVLKVKELSAKGYTSKVIAKRIGIHPFVATKSQRQSRNYSQKQLIAFINYITDIDAKIKTGQIEDFLGIELIVLELCR